MAYQHRQHEHETSMHMNWAKQQQKIAMAAIMALA
jgi:hypothetical protein